MSQIIHVLPELEIGRKTKAEKQQSRRGRYGHHNNARVPDEVVLTMRRMHEIERLPVLKVVAAFPQYSEEYVRSILAYRLRINLRIKPI